MHQRADVNVDRFTVTAIPEPSTYALLFGSLLLGFADLRCSRC
ncbi:MAG: PEP-CTERM sorting domain-containing protein [Opitutales bacterium]|nr:PEP-CTERM sorting domain-containing protein [Opitutales bacterium]